MSTQIFLRNPGSTNDGCEIANGDQGMLMDTRGSALATATISTINGPVTPAQVPFPNVWYSWEVDSVVYVAGTITVNAWASEDSMSANAALGAKIEYTDQWGNVLGTVAQGAISTELPLTTRAAQNFTLTPNAGIVLVPGQRFKVTLYLADGGGNMVTGFHGTVSYSGTTAAADGDAFVTFTENFGFALPAASPKFVSAPVHANNGGGGTTHAATLPSGYVAGDLLVLVISWSKSTNGACTISTPSGWTKSFEQLNSDNATKGGGTTYFTKISAGTEGASVTITISASGQITHTGYAFLNGTFHPISPVGASAGSTTGAGSQDVTIPAITLVGDNSLVIACVSALAALDTSTRVVLHRLSGRTNTSYDVTTAEGGGGEGSAMYWTQAVVGQKGTSLTGLTGGAAASDTWTKTVLEIVAAPGILDRRGYQQAVKRASIW